MNHPRGRFGSVVLLASTVSFWVLGISFSTLNKDDTSEFTGSLPMSFPTPLLESYVTGYHVLWS